MPSTAPVRNVLAEIEAATHHFAGARDELRGLGAQIQAEIAAIRERYRPQVRAAASAAADARTELEALINGHRDVFEEPRTRVFSGIKVGLRKMPGTIAWDDAQAVVQAIRKELPDKAATLIRVKEEPIKQGLATLDVRELASIGCRLTDTTDTIVIHAPEDQIDKLIKALTEEEEAQS